MNRISLLLPIALAGALSACGSPGPDEAQPSQAASSAPETKPGLALTGGRLILPAVSGNPAAAYFTLANGSDRPVTIAAVDVAGAGMAMLHETQDMAGHSEMHELAGPQVAPGASVAFAPGGKHVMIAGVPATWKPGGTAEITLTFADGDKLSAPLRIEPAGGR